MAKTQRKLKKNIEKTKEKQKKDYPLKNQIMYFSKLIYAILIVAMLIYMITVIANNTYKLEEVSLYDRTQILAGQTFSKLEEEYYVVFYDFNTESTLTTTIEEIDNQVIYKVDLGLANNKSVIADSGNQDASSATDLRINGATVIKINNGKNISYIEGYDNVNNYLKSL